MLFTIIVSLLSQMRLHPHGNCRLNLRALPLCFTACCDAAWAAGGRPMTTDDAALTTAQSCQIESYFQHMTRDGQLWVLPACNPTGNFELTAGALLDQPADAGDGLQYTVQGKSVWPHAPGDNKDFATAGVAFGAFYLDGFHHSGSGWDSAFAYVPLTLRWSNTVQTHFNLGWNQALTGHHNDLTYAGALAHDFGSKHSGFLEVFGDGRAPPTVQTGGAIDFAGGDLQLDATFGRPVNSGWRDAVFSVGLEWYPPALWGPKKGKS